jgi:uncharacterized membrane protein
MRWLLIALLVSLAALLMAAAGVVRHIQLQRTRSLSKPPADAGQTPDAAPGPAEEADQETEI